MTYLYVRCKKDTGDFFKDINFQNFNRNENCCVIYDGNEINFSVLDTLEFGIADKVYKIDKTIEFSHNDKNNHLTNGNRSSKLFFKYLTDKILSKLTILESDYEIFIEYIKSCRCLSTSALRNITKNYIESGNVHLLLDCLDLSGIDCIHKLCLEHKKEDKFYECKNYDRFFDALHLKFQQYKHCNEIRKKIREIALHYTTINISRKNYDTLKSILLIHDNYHYSRLCRFLEGQVLCEGTKLPCLQGDVKYLKSAISDCFYGEQVKNFLFNCLLDRIRNGEKLSFDQVCRCLLLGVSERKKIELFDLT